MFGMGLAKVGHERKLGAKCLPNEMTLLNCNLSMLLVKDY